MDEVHGTLGVQEPPGPKYAPAIPAEVARLWRTLFEEQRAEILAKMRTEAERAERIIEEMKRRKLYDAVPDHEVAKHLPATPAQRELPIPAGRVDKGKKRR
jgi:hypothetical protein